MMNILLKKAAIALSVLLIVLDSGAGYANVSSDPAGYASFPIIINSVSATRNRDRTVSVNWIIDKEIGTRQYELERSTDGFSFYTIDITATTSNNGERNIYDLIDWNALNTEAFYRIKAVSLTGKPHYSAIVKVELLKTTSPIRVYPNPVFSKTVNVHFTNQPKGEYSLILFNQLGQSLWNTTISVENNIDVRTFQLGQNIPAGSYKLTILEPGDKKSTQQLIIN